MFICTNALDFIYFHSARYRRGPWIGRWRIGNSPTLELWWGCHSFTWYWWQRRPGQSILPNSLRGSRQRSAGMDALWGPRNQIPAYFPPFWWCPQQGPWSDDGHYHSESYTSEYLWQWEDFQPHVWVLQPIGTGSSTSFRAAADWTELHRCGETKGNHNQRSWMDQDSPTPIKCRYVRYWSIGLDPGSLHHSSIQIVVGRVERTSVLYIGSDIPRHDRPQV